MCVCKDVPEVLATVVFRLEGTYPWLDRAAEVLSQTSLQDQVDGLGVLLTLF